MFFADTTVNINPTVEEIVDITLLVAKTVKQYKISPKIALLSYSNFGSNDQVILEDVVLGINQILNNSSYTFSTSSTDSPRRFNLQVIPAIISTTDKIEKGNYFFTDIKKEGIKLYDSGNYKLPRRRKLDPAERKAHAIEDYEHWYSSANGFLKMYQSALQEGENNIAAFQLHQATERYYHAVLLVFTGYKPKLHNIEILGRKACNLQPEICKAFPNSGEKEKRTFGLLKDAYVDARYKKDYKITKDELTYLSKCVEKLQQLTQELCKKYIDNITVAEK